MTVRSTGTSVRAIPQVGAPHPRGVEEAKKLDPRVQKLRESMERVLSLMEGLKAFGIKAFTANVPIETLANRAVRINILSSQCEALIGTLSKRCAAISGQIMGGTAEGRAPPASRLPLRERNPQHLPSGDPRVHKLSVAARAQLKGLQTQLTEASKRALALGAGTSFLSGRIAMTPSFVPPSSLAIARYLLENGELPGGGTVIGRGGFGEVRVVPMGGNGSFVTKSDLRAAVSGGGAAADALSSKGSWEDASADTAGGFNWTGSGSNGGGGESDAFDLSGAARAGALALGGPSVLANEAAIHAQAAAACPDFVMPMTGIFKEMIIMPKADGTLGSHIRAGRLEISHALWLAEGLADLHDAGFVHRDLKAENFLVYKELPRLTDFGCARHVHEGETVKEDTPIGTHTTMAPEVMSCRPHDLTAADVFSFGVLLYQMASHGHLPWEDDQGKPLGVQQQFYALTVQSPPRPPNLDHIADGPCKDLIRRMLSYVPAERPTMAEVAKDPALQIPLPMIVGDAGAGAAQVEPASRAGRDA